MSTAYRCNWKDSLTLSASGLYVRRNLPMASISNATAVTLAESTVVDATFERSEEPINMATHGIGLLLSVAGSAWLVTTALQAGGVTRIAGCTVYAASLIAVYLFSTLSHTFVTGEARQKFRALDQAFIYFLIVGTYTPIALAYLHGGAHTMLLSLMWGVAIFGFLSKTLWRHRINSISTASYLVLGWMPVVSIPAAWMMMPIPAIALLVAGGLAYTFGVVFLINDKRVPYFHAVWHLLVMIGSACHFAAILNHVAMPLVG